VGGNEFAAVKLNHDLMASKICPVKISLTNFLQIKKEQRGDT
jgi:hypothetical protein